MNAITLAIASIRSRPLHALLCVMAAASGITLLSAVFLLSQGVSSSFVRNAAGIDIVAGTKGSPLQLVLSSVYHVDIPTGNISMEDYKRLKRNPHVRKAIPLALGDSYRGFRMVGTTKDYIGLYKAQFARGRVFSENFEAVAGADTRLEIGDSFSVSHGFSTEGSGVHGSQLYTVTGVLKPTGTVLDKLITTTVESVQQLHAHHNDEERPHADHEGLTRQLTSVLLKVRSPINLMNLPRQINNSSNIMAVVPSYEIARLTRSLGLGRKLIMVVGGGIIILSALVLLASLASGLALRRYDLAVLRVLGAGPGRLCATVIAEGMILSGVGAVLGVCFGHLTAYFAALMVESLRGMVLPESLLEPGVMDLGLIGLGLMVGLLASFIPSFSAANTDIAGLLAKGRV